MRRKGPPPVTITDAPRSIAAERRGREVRYVIMMSIRAVALIVLVVLVSYRVPLAWLWAPVCLAAMVLLPWLAVQTANEADRRRSAAKPRRRRAAETDEFATALPASAPPRVIDADPPMA